MKMSKQKRNPERGNWFDKIPAPLKLIPYIGGLITILLGTTEVWNLIEPFLPKEVTEFGTKNLTFIINILIPVIFIFLWFKKDNHKKGIENFSEPWIAFWFGLTIYYLCKLVYGENLEVQFDYFLNNANTIFIFLIYTLLAFPKGVDSDGNRIIASSYFGSFVVLLLIGLFSYIFEDYGKIFSGLFAFFGFCFLGSRLESFFPKNYFVIIFIFSYAAVQVFWIFELDQHELISTPFIYFMASLGKIFLGYIITYKYEDITEKSVRYFEVKYENENMDTNYA